MTFLNGNRPFEIEESCSIPVAIAAPMASFSEINTDILGKNELFSTCSYCSAHGISNGFSRRNSDAAKEQGVVVLPCQGSLQAAGRSSLHAAFAAHPAGPAHQLCCQHTWHLCTHMHRLKLLSAHAESLYTHGQTEVAVSTFSISAHTHVHTHVACHGKLTSQQEL